MPSGPRSESLPRSRPFAGRLGRLLFAVGAAYFVGQACGTQNGNTPVLQNPPAGSVIETPRVYVSVSVLPVDPGTGQDFDVTLTLEGGAPQSIRSQFSFWQAAGGGHDVYDTGLVLPTGTHHLTIVQFLSSGGQKAGAPVDFTVVDGPTTEIEVLGDAGASITGQLGQGATQLAGGESWILFGETNLTSGASLAATQADSSADDGDASNGIDLTYFNEPTAVQEALDLEPGCNCPSLPHEEEVWLSGPIERGSDVFVYFTRVDHDATPNEQGVGLARATGGAVPFQRLIFSQDPYWGDSYSLFQAGEFLSVRGVVPDPDGVHIVLFGTRVGASSALQDREVVLARVPLAQLENRAAYEFWTDDGGGPAWRSATTGWLPMWTNSTPPSVVSSSYLGKWLSVSSEQLGNPPPYTNAYALRLESTIQLRVADTLTGPWSSPKTVWSYPPPHGQSSAMEPVYLSGFDALSNLYVMATDDSDDPPDVPEPPKARLYQIDLDEVVPTISISSPTQGALLGSRPVQVSGTTARADTVTVNGVEAEITGSTWSASIFLDEGTSTIEADAINDFGTASDSVDVTLDVTPPLVAIAQPPDGATFTASPVLVSGSVADASSITSIDVAGTAVLPGTSFSKPVPLVSGPNTITVTATDAAGHMGQDQITVTLGTAGALAITVDGDGSATHLSTVTVTGTRSHAAATVTVNGLPEDPSVTGANWAVPNVPLSLGPNLITATAQLTPDQASVSIQMLRTSAAAPPPPTAPVPSEIDPSAATNFFDDTKFLYDGPSPVQTGLTATIEERQVGVIRGRVLTRGGAPLPSVAVSIKDHPEYGSTLTRADGFFDLVVNGGMPHVLHYSRSGFFPATRRVDVPWRDFSLAPDVVLLLADLTSAPVFQNQGVFQVAQGSVVTDAQGTRQPTFLFPPGTTATPDVGSLPSPFHVRMTDAQIGVHGTSTIPADLPPGVVAGSVAEFSIDEAEAAGATRVDFSQPVLLYEENYLGLPVGDPFPMAFADEGLAGFVGESSGLVVEVTGESGGMAQLDADGDGLGDTPNDNAILAMGPQPITNAERTEIASLYDPGQELWRVPVAHFSGWCGGHGKPVVAAGAEAPNVAAPGDPHPDCASCSGSVLHLGSQSLGEEIPLVGTPFSLHYVSSRTPGYREGFSLDIPVMKSTVPSTPPNSIQVDVRAGGGFFFIPESSIPVEPDGTFTPNGSVPFTWDGTDVYGRVLQGRQPIRVVVKYAYDFFFDDGRVQEGFLTQPWSGFVGPWDARGYGLGGWTLSPHHFYDPNGKILYRGDGTQRRAEDLPFVSSVPIDGLGAFTLAVAVGSDGTIYAHRSQVSNDEIVALDLDNLDPETGEIGGASTILSIPRDITAIAAAPDGSLYVASDAPSHLVQRWTFEGGAASTTVLDEATDNILSVQGLALASDGSLFVADTGRSRLLRVSADGTKMAIAGEGTRTLPSAFGFPAAEADFGVAPVSGVAVGRDGSVYAALRLAGGLPARVVRIDPSGILREFAGAAGSAANNMDGMAALGLVLEQPRGLAVGSDQSVYVTTGQSSSHRIWRITPTGTAQTVLGTGQPGSGGVGNAGPRTELDNPGAIAVAPDGTLYVADTSNSRVVQLGSALPGFLGSVLAGIPGKIFVPSEDGTELYEFDPNGRHEQTLDALTGDLIYDFRYGPGQRLASIVDASGNIHEVLRDTSGHPIGFRAPFGQESSFTLDANGYLETVADPAGNTYTMAYDPDGGGLLLSFEDPNQHASTFSYDGMGRLQTDTDAKQAIKTVGIVESTPQREELTLTSDEGRVTRFELDDLGSGDELQTLTPPAGPPSQLTIGARGTKRLSIPGVLDATLEETGDARFAFGMAAPVPARLTLDTPGGRHFERAQTRTLSPLTDTIQVNQFAPTDPKATVVYDDTTDPQAPKVITSTFEDRVLTDTLDPATGRLVATAVTGIHPVSLSYDPEGRLETLSQGTAGVDERQVTFTYDPEGNLDTVTDPLGRTVGFDYDASGRVTSQTLLDAAQNPVHTIGFGYDAKGNLTSLTPPGKPAHIFTYTDVDQEETYDPPAITPPAPATIFAYNGDRQLDLVTRPDGATIDLVYGTTTGRLDQVVIPRGTIDLTYHPTTGNVDTLTAPGGELLTLGYDGPLPTSSTWSGTVSGSVSQTYDDFLRVDLQQVNGDPAHDASFGYDLDGLLTQAGAEILTRRPDNGLLDTTTLGTVATSQTYNNFGELDTFTATDGTVTLYNLDVDRDDLGRITRKEETTAASGTVVRSYEYDPAGRLWHVWAGEIGTGTLQKEYLYDANGNRLSEAPGDPTQVGFYDDQDRLTSYEGASYNFNLAGDLATKTEAGQTTTYTYDALGNLVNVTFADGRQIEYVIDGQNRRIAKKVCPAPCGNPTTEMQLERAWLYQDQLNPVAELDDQGQVTARFVYGSKPNVPDYVVKGITTYRVLSDQLGSPRVVVDVATAAVAQEISYGARGNPTITGPVDFQPFGFAGGLYDPETGFVRFGARDYEPRVGRWTAKDPTLFAGLDANLYRYTLSDPLNLIDQVGRRAQGAYPPQVVGAAGALFIQLGCGIGVVGGQLLTNPFASPAAEALKGIAIVGSGIVVGGTGVFLGVIAAGGALQLNLPLAFAAGLGSVQLLGAGGAAAVVGTQVTGHALGTLGNQINQRCSCPPP